MTLYEKLYKKINDIQDIADFDRLSISGSNASIEIRNICNDFKKIIEDEFEDKPWLSDKKVMKDIEIKKRLLFDGNRILETTVCICRYLAQENINEPNKSNIKNIYLMLEYIHNLPEILLNISDENYVWEHWIDYFLGTFKDIKINMLLHPDSKNINPLYRIFINLEEIVSDFCKNIKKYNLALSEAN
jgi:hypothetical protein